jgi:hypothetical protein
VWIGGATGSLPSYSRLCLGAPDGKIRFLRPFGPSTGRPVALGPPEMKRGNGSTLSHGRPTAGTNRPLLAMNGYEV